MKSFFYIIAILGIVIQSPAQKKWVNVADYGAVSGNESIDNYPFFLTAITYAEKNQIPNIKIPAGTFYISKGFNLDDNFSVCGAGMDNTIIRLIKNLPPRRNEANQTAVFTGKKSYSLSNSATTNNITIKGLTIDLQKPPEEFNIEKFSMLGGIRLINPVNCLIDSVKIINPPKFGIGLYATAGGDLCTMNTIQNCNVVMQGNWYLQLTPVVVPRAKETCIGIEISSPLGDKHNGSAIFLDRNNADYIISKARKNTVENTSISGGSHGISISNACDNSLLNNNIKDCSHRGIIIISCSDSNLIYRNTITNVGSTGIHMAYNCSFNVVKDNTVNGVLGVEGDGIKSYINCNNNQITGNTVSNFAIAGIRVSHGANNNLIENNTITGNDLPIQIGIKIIANNKQQYNDGFRFDNMLTANNNICINNTISDVPKGVLISDEMKLNNSLRNNKTNGNRFQKVTSDYDIKANQ